MLNFLSPRGAIFRLCGGVGEILIGLRIGLGEALRPLCVCMHVCVYVCVCMYPCMCVYMSMSLSVCE